MSHVAALVLFSPLRDQLVDLTCDITILVHVICLPHDAAHVSA